MLEKPPYIAASNIAVTELRFAWDEWNVVEAYSPADPALMARMAALSYRANLALCASIGEWVVWRFEKVSDDPAPLQGIEAAWAASIHHAYARYTEFVDDQWRGPIRGPMRIALEILFDLVWGLKDSRPGENVAYMHKLAARVLPDSTAFQPWMESCVARLEAHYPASPKPKLQFSDEIELGPWVPRDLFDPARPFDPSQSDEWVKRFLGSLDPTRNRYLRTAAEVREVPDFEGVPYQAPPRG